MAKTLVLLKDGKEILGSDGVMYVDGRLNIHSIKEAVKARNKSLVRNFPHKVCDSFGICTSRLNYSNVIKL